MGINQLLKSLKSITKQKHVKEYSNMSVAVDTYCWLHKAIYTCAEDLAEGRETDEYINYCVRRVEMLQSYNIRVVMVFDGGKLPSKNNTEDERERKRKDNLSKAQEYKKQGDREKAFQKFAESIDVTPQMAYRLLAVLQLKNIECIVAPFEADAQLAYLSITKYVDVLITEDSDLIAYGALKVFYKMDKSGSGEEIELSQLVNCNEFNFQGWQHNQFLTLCILSGCDYLDSIPGVGMKTAYAAIIKNTNYRQLIDSFQRQSKYNVPDNYLEMFEFQRVFCPIQRKVVTLHDIDVEGWKQNPKIAIVEPNMIRLFDGSELHYLGEQHPDEIAQKIADGKICPQSLQPYDTTTSKTTSQQSKILQQQLEFDKPIYGQNTHQVFKVIRSVPTLQTQEEPIKKTIKLKQQHIGTFFQKNTTTMKPFKPPGKLEQENIKVNNDKDIQEKVNNNKMIIESENQQQSQRFDPQIDNFEQYSMTEEWSCNQQMLSMKHYYNDFGGFLERQICFNQL